LRENRHQGKYYLLTDLIFTHDLFLGSTSYVRPVRLRSNPNLTFDHSFYSWRRYCNKHQIRLGGYTMNPDRSISPNPEGDQDIEDEVIHAGPGPGTIAAAQQRVQVDVSQPRNHSPTPPRALFRSTTGKGVAFTDEDVAFLVRFMEYRK